MPRVLSALDKYPFSQHKSRYDYYHPHFTNEGSQPLRLDHLPEVSQPVTGCAGCGTQSSTPKCTYLTTIFHGLSHPFPLLQPVNVYGHDPD